MAERSPYVAVTGRFQPFHCDHLQLLHHALLLADRLVIAITNPDSARRLAHPSSAHRHRDDANPYSYHERQEMIAAALSRERQFAGRFVIKPCDLDDPSTWSRVFPPGTMQLVRIFSDWEREKVRRFRAAGYAVCDLSGDVSRRIAATDIRAAIWSGREWAHLVPPGTREWLLARHAPDCGALAKRRGTLLA